MDFTIIVKVPVFNMCHVLLINNSEKEQANSSEYAKNVAVKVLISFCEFFYLFYWMELCFDY